MTEAQSEPPVPSDGHARPDRADGTTRGHTPASGAIAVLIFLLLAIYLTGFWGWGLSRAMRLGWFPHELGIWYRFCQTDLAPLWRGSSMRWLVAQTILAMLVPAALMLPFRRYPTHVGIGLPNVLGYRLILISVVLSIPFGLWLLGTLPEGSLDRMDYRRYAYNLAAMVPEHYLICGTAVALMLPGYRLPHPVPLAPVAGSRLVRVLRWMGLAQPAAGSGSRPLAWMGLTGASLWAILASGTLFWLGHVGKEHGLEVLLSWPGGVAVSYVTLRSRSIWPAVIAHWTMNLIPLTLLFLLLHD